MVTRVTVIVVNFNGGDTLLRWMRCLAAQSMLPERIDVIDNGSSDGSIEALGVALTVALPDADRAHIAGRVAIERVDRNIGFAAANNRGLARCATPLVALLNADAFAEPQWLERMCAAAAAHPVAASFGSRQMLEGRPGVIDGLGDFYHISGLPQRARHRQRLGPADLAPCEIFSPYAAAALYRTDAVRAVGAFDEDYFCYSEAGATDILRAFSVGWSRRCGVSHAGAGRPGA